jgi:hypothetical protein
MALQAITLSAWNGLPMSPTIPARPDIFLHHGGFAIMTPNSIEQPAHSRANFIVGLIVLALTGFGGALAIRLLFFH